MQRNKLREWREVLPTLPSPKLRPNDYQKLILGCISRGMSVRDTERVFGVSEHYVQLLKRKFPNPELSLDRDYYIDRARKLGAEQETIDEWFN